MLKLKLQYFGHLMRRVDSLAKTLMLGGIGGKRRRGRQMRWHYWLNEPKFEQTPGDSKWQGSLACCSPWCHKELDSTMNNKFVLLFSCWVVIHIVKGFSVVIEAEVRIFLEFPCFLHDPTNVGNLISGSSAFSKTSLNIWSSQFTYCWSLAWRILSIILLPCQMSTHELSNCSSQAFCMAV